MSDVIVSKGAKLIRWRIEDPDPLAWIHSRGVPGRTGSILAAVGYYLFYRHPLPARAAASQLDAERQAIAQPAVRGSSTPPYVLLAGTGWKQRMSRRQP